MCFFLDFIPQASEKRLLGLSIILIVADCIEDVANERSIRIGVSIILYFVQQFIS